jgi:hypothetical protein
MDPPLWTGEGWRLRLCRHQSPAISTAVLSGIRVAAVDGCRDASSSMHGRCRRWTVNSYPSLMFRPMASTMGDE